MKVGAGLPRCGPICVYPSPCVPAARQSASRGVAGCRQDHQCPVHGGGERDPAVHPGQPQQPTGLRPEQTACRLPPCTSARRAAPIRAPSPAESVKVIRLRSTINGCPLSASPNRRSCSPAAVDMSISPVTSAITTPRPRYPTRGSPAGAFRTCRAPGRPRTGFARWSGPARVGKDQAAQQDRFWIWFSLPYGPCVLSSAVFGYRISPWTHHRSHGPSHSEAVSDGCQVRGASFGSRAGKVRRPGGRGRRLR